jgi:hypothetical protein
MLGLSLAVAALQAAQAQLSPAHEGLRSRLLVAALCYAQPLVRSFRRYRTRLLAYAPPMAPPGVPTQPGTRLSLSGTLTAAYWTEDGCERMELLGLAIAYLSEHGWGKTIDTGWSDWDLEVHCHPWTVVQVCTAQEEHGGGRRLIRVRYRLRCSGYMKALGAGALLTGTVAVGLLALPAAMGAGFLLSVCGGIAASCVALWWKGTRRAAHAVGVIDALARDLGMLALGGGEAGPRG